MFRSRAQGGWGGHTLPVAGPHLIHKGTWRLLLDKAVGIPQWSDPSYWQAGHIRYGRLQARQLAGRPAGAVVRSHAVLSSGTTWWHPRASAGLLGLTRGAGVNSQDNQSLSWEWGRWQRIPFPVRSLGAGSQPPPAPALLTEGADQPTESWRSRPAGGGESVQGFRRPRFLGSVLCSSFPFSVPFCLYNTRSPRYQLLFSFHLTQSRILKISLGVQYLNYTHRTTRKH